MPPPVRAAAWTKSPGSRDALLQARGVPAQTRPQCRQGWQLPTTGPPRAPSKPSGLPYVILNAKPWKLRLDEIDRMSERRDTQSKLQRQLLPTAIPPPHRPFPTQTPSQWLPSSPAELSAPPPVAWRPARRRSRPSPRRTPRLWCVKFPRRTHPILGKQPGRA